MGKPMLPNLEPLLAMGISPKTGLPLKVKGNRNCNLKEEVKKQLRIKDEQTAVNRYVWEDIPENMNLTSQEIERLVYYKANLCAFYFEEIDEYLLLPYALDGTIDVYGRYNYIHPVPMTSGMDEDSKSPVAQLLANKKLKCIHNVNAKVDDPKACCVLLHDYTKQMSQINIPRANLQDALLDVMAEMIPFARTSALLGTGIKAFRVQDADQESAAIDAAIELEQCALNGIPWTSVIAKMEFQDLAPGQLAKVEEYYLSMQSLDNYRLSLYGLGEGVYEKKAHTLESEQEMNKGPNELVMEDGLTIRQNFADIFNKLFGTSLKVKKNEVEAQVIEDEEEFDSEEKEGDDNHVDSEL